MSAEQENSIGPSDTAGERKQQQQRVIMSKPLFIPNKVSRMSWLFPLLFRNVPTGVIKCMNSPYKT